MAEAPKFEIGDASQDITFAAVGAALSQWEHLEAWLANIFIDVCGFIGEFEPNSAVGRAYGTVVAFTGRVQMIEAAAEVFFAEKGEDDDSKRLRAVIAKARGLSGRRNEIAHGIVQPWGRDRGFALVPSWYATRKMTLIPKRHGFSDAVPSYAYRSVEIYSFRDAFKELAEEAVRIRVHEPYFA
ncbi:MAG: hypothetical protein OJJ21_14215 [Ferrovibrio sp.]|uniref:hypothetical protein n=1 Tax=Ferrovibrio sp. TaxID=1917215 RepID=UPI00260D64A3|nr:hypothetical protein [Ferrovibrio sp.]MCW0234750.1 hypothetical protein [Ferrovibrio sp.]